MRRTWRSRRGAVDDASTSLGINFERVVGVAGDMLEMREKRLKVNGKEVAEPYVIHEDDAVFPNNAPEEYRIRDNFGPLRVPAGMLFVLGDNRDNSADSRYWGPIASDSVTGGR